MLSFSLSALPESSQFLLHYLSSSPVTWEVETLSERLTEKEFFAIASNSAPRFLVAPLGSTFAVQNLSNRLLANVRKENLPFALSRLAALNFHSLDIPRAVEYKLRQGQENSSLDLDSFSL